MPSGHGTDRRLRFSLPVQAIKSFSERNGYYPCYLHQICCQENYFIAYGTLLFRIFQQIR